MIGRTISRYRIVSKLGEGGMGSVWKAEDPLLGRTLALKFLPESVATLPDTRARFLREARSASVLEHSGIATVYDAGESDGLVYIALQHVDGETVAQRIARGIVEIPEAARIAMDAVEALGHAHTRGVLHRDVTSRNIMIARDGRVIVVDFGLALPEGDTRVTRTGATMGTVAYMAPEVIQGKPADRRSDLYGLGVVLYEMLAGRAPFEGDRAETVLYAAVHTEPEPPGRRRAGVPPHLDAIVMKLLEKDPERRYQSAAEVVEDIKESRAPDRARVRVSQLQTIITPTPRRLSRRWRGAAMMAGLGIIVAVLWATGLIRGPAFTQPAIASVAVLPLTNNSADPNESNHIASGIGAELTNKLNQLAGVRVIPWVTAQRYKDQNRPLAEIAQELNVDALIIGTFRKAGDRYQGTVSLVEARSGQQTWSDEFDEAATDLFALQGQIAIGTATRMKGKLSGIEEEVLARPAGSNGDAYDLYLRGAELLRLEDRESLDRALAFFEKAVQLDPDLAEAHVGVGAANMHRLYRGWAGDIKTIDIAIRSYQRAIQLNPRLGMARGGLITAHMEKAEYEEVLRLGKEAGELARDNVEMTLAQAQAYTSAGLVEKAIPLLQRVMQLDPSDEAGQWYLVMSYAWAGEFNDAIEAGEVYFNRFGEEPDVHAWVGAAYHAMGEWEPARVHYERAAKLMGDSGNQWVLAFLGRLYEEMGDVKAARAQYQRGLTLARQSLRSFPDNPRMRSSLAGFSALLGDRETFLNEVAWHEKMFGYAPENMWEGLIGYTLFGDTTHAVDTLRVAMRRGQVGMGAAHLILLVYGLQSLEETPEYQELLVEWENNVKRLRALY